MKRKFFSVLLALVLVLSFGLVTALPVSAEVSTHQVVPYDLGCTEDDGAVAEWSTQDGDIVVHLNTGPSEGDGDTATIAINASDVGITTLAEIMLITWSETSVGYPAHVDIMIDTDGDEVVDDALVVEYAYNAGDHPLVTDMSNAWLTSRDPGPLGADPNVFAYHTLQEWKIGVTVEALDSWVEKTIDQNTSVLALEIEVDNWIEASESHIKYINVNGVLYFGSIQDAVNHSGVGDTVAVAAGIFEEDLVIALDKTGLELAGAEGAIIKGVQNVWWDDWPLAVPNIDIWADGVKIHGFTIEGPDYVADYYASGIVLDGTNIEIYDNDFVDTPANTTDELNHSITTYSLTAIEDADCSGLNIHDNTFTGSGATGSEFIYINPHTGTGSVTIDTNQFSGSVAIGATVESGSVTFTNNTIINETGAGLYGVRFMDSQYGANGIYEDIVISGNEISGCDRAVRVGNGSNPGTSLFTATVSFNTLTGNELDVWCRNGSQLVVVNDNSMTSITNPNGDSGTITIDPQNNWWGQASGPGDGITGDVDAEPWLLTEGGTHYDKTLALNPGWSIVSPDAELASCVIVDSVGLVYAYNNGGFGEVTSPDPITPVFIKTTDGGGIGFNYAADSMGIFTTDLEAGWNLIGVPATSATPGAILSPLRYGANNEVALATLASQGDYNPSGASFYRAMLSDDDWQGLELPQKRCFDGYWAYMNVAKEFGVVVIP